MIHPTEDHKNLRDLVHNFGQKEVEPFAQKHNRQESFHLKAFRKMGELGLLGITIEEKYGGTGMDAVAAVIVCEELAYFDPGFCLSYLAHSILCAHNLALNGSETQKLEKLPLLCRGEWIGAMALSESQAGTDVFNISTSAQKKGACYTINGRKMWITNGVLDEKNSPADVVLLYAITKKREASSSNKPHLSAFLIEKTHPGYKAGQVIKNKTGMRSSYTAELVFDHCQVPNSSLIGKEGQASLHMLRNMEIERLTLAAMSLGIAKRSLQIMNTYAGEREAFSHPLFHFGQIQKYIARSFAEYMAARSYVYHTAQSLKLHLSHQRPHSDGVKLFAATMGKNVADRAMQVLGGYGYVEEFVVERMWRDAKLLEIGGGTSEALEKNITRDLQKKPEILLN